MCVYSISVVLKSPVILLSFFDVKVYAVSRGVYYRLEFWEIIGISSFNTRRIQYL
jgi:hypothetical protein